ncbi:MAG: NAD(P)-binding protein [Pseudomonadota bacterium]
MTRLTNGLTRRDFMNGVALSVAAGALPPGAMLARAETLAPYPPSLTGLRGAHVGAFETAHALAWEGRKWKRPEIQTEGLYDLIVVGAGLSGLAAAHLFKARAGRPVKILLLDNHDDFGGHAKRNEFDVDGKKLIGYGGSQSIDGPGSYSDGAKEILADLGVDVAKFHSFYDTDFYERRKMRAGMYLDAKAHGAASLTDVPFKYWTDAPDPKTIKAAIKESALKEETKTALKKLVLGSDDFLAGKTTAEKTDYLRTISYEEFLRTHALAPEELIKILRPVPHGIWGVGWDALSALEAARWGMPATQGLGLEGSLHNDHESEEPYIFHFPDGNAGLARLLARKLAPQAIPGSTMEDIVTAQADYSKLDLPGSDVRLRLGATAVDMKHSQSRKSVDVVYVKDGETHRVRGRHAIMAGYMAMAPYMCSELPEAQKEAIRFFTKIPLVYGNVALRNWRAFERAGFSRIYSPSSFFEQMALDFPVSIGDYKFSASPDDPILLHLQYVPVEPGVGLNEKDQHRAGRARIYGLTYDDFETAIVEQLTGMMGPHGFDAERDIAGITVNRWPHGYAYEYNELFDGPDWSPKSGPHLEARKPIGRISLANSDTSAYAYVNGAFDAAIRAVEEQLAITD